jgi:hypothetical protein
MNVSYSSIPALRFVPGIIACVFAMLFACAAHADVFHPAYLELRQQGADVYDVFWKIPIQAQEKRASMKVRMPEGTQVVLPPRTENVEGAVIERWRVQRSGGLQSQVITIDGLAANSVDVLVRVVRTDGTEQVTRLLPASTSFVVEGSKGAFDVAWTYLKLGVHHILAGVDHLLFVLALLLIVRGVRRVIVTITAFTIAHSITLGAASLGLVHMPSAPVEAMIALSIVFVAAEIVHGLQGRPGLTARAPWVVAFTFGLLHGFGFAGALSEVGLPPNAIPIALLFFNVGVEIGQLVFVAAVAIVMLLMQRTRIRWPRWAEYVPAYAIGGMAMFWVIERVMVFGAA